MALLVMDTSTDALCVAVGRPDGAYLSGTVGRIPRGHSRLLQPSIQFVLQSAGLDVQRDIERIGVGVGPGSYTGVRMGVATAKAMAQALCVPVIAIPTLDAFAVAAMKASPQTDQLDVLSLLYARRHRAFGARFRFKHGQMVEREAARVDDIAGWLESFSASPTNQTNARLVVHDIPQTELATHSIDMKTLWVTPWSSASALLSDALLDCARSNHYETVTGDALHALAPDYALPVEAEAKLQGGTGE